jgi:hypothetical protein
MDEALVFSLVLLGDLILLWVVWQSVVGWTMISSNVSLQIQMNMQENICMSMAFGGSDWINITVEEMVHFLTVVLNMSIDNREL